MLIKISPGATLSCLSVNVRIYSITLWLWWRPVRISIFISSSKGFKLHIRYVFHFCLVVLKIMQCKSDQGKVCGEILLWHQSTPHNHSESSLANIMLYFFILPTTHQGGSINSEFGLCVLVCWNNAHSLPVVLLWQVIVLFQSRCSSLSLKPA